jgi:hypothetical protein
MKIEAAVRERVVGELAQAVQVMRARMREYEQLVARTECVVAALQELRESAPDAEVLTDPARFNAVLSILIQRPYGSVADLVPRYRQVALAEAAKDSAARARKKKE